MKLQSKNKYQNHFEKVVELTKLKVRRAYIMGYVDALTNAQWTLEEMDKEAEDVDIAISKLEKEL